MEGDEGFEGALDYFPDTFNPNKIQPEFSGESSIAALYSMNGGYAYFVK